MDGGLATLSGTEDAAVLVVVELGVRLASWDVRFGEEEPAVADAAFGVEVNLCPQA